MDMGCTALLAAFVSFFSCIQTMYSVSRLNLQRAWSKGLDT